MNHLVVEAMRKLHDSFCVPMYNVSGFDTIPKALKEALLSI